MFVSNITDKLIQGQFFDPDQIGFFFSEENVGG